jgi:hypothetical protein
MLMYTTGGTNNLIQLFSATATYANNVTCSSQTSPVYQTGSSGNYAMFSNVTAGTPVVHPILYKFGASTYPGLQILNPGSINQLVRALCKDL